MHTPEFKSPAIRCSTIEAWRRDGSVVRGRPVRIAVDHEFINAFEGESLVVALAAAGYVALRQSPTAGAPRAAFCLMGVCQECVVHVDGASVTACLEPVREGMTVALDQLARGRDTAMDAH